MDRRISNFFKSTNSKILLAVLASLLAVSETSIKSIVNAWLDDCRIIVEISKLARCPENDNNCLGVRLYAIGDTFPDFRLNLQSGETLGAIRKISFRADYTESNLSVHPRAGESCGPTTAQQTFCSIEEDRPFEAIINFDELSSNYTYLFEVELQQTGQPVESHLDEFQIYSKPLNEDRSRLRCKVESSSWLNFIARRGTLTKFLALCIFASLLIVALAALNRQNSDA